MMPRSKLPKMKMILNLDIKGLALGVTSHGTNLRSCYLNLAVSSIDTANRHNIGGEVPRATKPSKHPAAMGQNSSKEVSGPPAANPGKTRSAHQDNTPHLQTVNSAGIQTDRNARITSETTTQLNNANPGIL